MLRPTHPLQPTPPTASEDPVAEAPLDLASLRVVRPVRDQPEAAPRTLDALVAEDHPVRAIWALLEWLDLTAFYRDIRAVLDGPGRPASDPLALWIFATVEGISSARRLAELSAQHHAYRWPRGGVPLNDHLLATFRALLANLISSQALSGAKDQVGSEMLDSTWILRCSVNSRGLQAPRTPGRLFSWPVVAEGHDNSAQSLP